MQISLNIFDISKYKLESKDSWPVDVIELSTTDIWYVVEDPFAKALDQRYTIYKGINSKSALVPVVPVRTKEATPAMLVATAFEYGVQAFQGLRILNLHIVVGHDVDHVDDPDCYRFWLGCAARIA